MAHKETAPGQGGGVGIADNQPTVSTPIASAKQHESQAQSTDGRAPARVDSIPLSRIKDGGAQMRVAMRPETVDDYANDMLDGATFPPVVVFYDGSDFWLGEGYHRIEAARKIGRDTITAEIREGSSRDAILYGVGANATHGLRRTQADKRRAVERLLKEPEWARWSDRKIAEIAKVDHKTVGTIRRELTGEFPTTNRTGEFPTEHKPNGKPMGRSSLLGDVLHKIPDDVLTAECRRRGLTVEAGDA